jgi:putative hydrolase of the HAD superfamily
MPRLTTIGFDADDTLWQNETFFRMTEAEFARLLADAAPAQVLMDRLIAAERRNIGHYGFGIKGFMLSMIETALEVTAGKVGGAVIGEILELGREMLRHPVELLPGAEATVRAMAEEFRVILVTKGDLLDQERKLAQSGLGDLFHGVEIVSDKTPGTYARIFARHGTGAGEGVMVGNSLKSDVIPMLDAGGFAVFVPHGLTWALEAAELPQDHPRFAEIDSLDQLPELLPRWLNDTQ